MKAVRLFLVSLLWLWNAAPAFTIPIEGQTPGGTYKQVAVSSTGQILTNSGGSNSTATCGLLKFKKIQINDNATTAIIVGTTTISQIFIFVEGPGDVLLSSQSATVGTYNGVFSAPFARFPNGLTFSLDAPASVVASYFAQAQDVGASTYTVLSITQCGN